MSIPLLTFLYIYLVAVGLIIIYTLVNLYHVLHHGHMDRRSSIMTGIFLIGFVFILAGSALFIGTIDWNTPILLFESGVNTTIPSTNF